MKLNFHLRSFIEMIEAYSDGFEELYDVDKDDMLRAGRICSKKEIIEKVIQSGMKYRVLKNSQDGVIQKIIITSPMYFNKTETIEDELYKMGYEGEFIKDAIKYRMSKQGRFVRVHFKTGQWIDLVPKGSIASGSLLCTDEDDKKRYHFVPASIDKLYQSWYKSNGR